MTEFEGTLFDLVRKKILNNENNSLNYILKMKIFNIFKTCECGKEMKLYPEKQMLCCNYCNGKRSFTDGSIWYYSHLNYDQILTLPYHFYYSHSLHETSMETCLHENTVKRWFKRFRMILFSKMIQYNNKIGGENKVVEIDEAIRMKRKNKVGKLKSQEWIVGGVERSYLYYLKNVEPTENFNYSSVYAIDENSKFKPKCFLCIVAERTEETLLKIILEKVEVGSIIVTDCWGAYNKLESYGFKHFTVNHSKNFVDGNTGACTNTVEGFWHLCRSSLPSRGVNTNNVYLYLSEFLYRKQNNNNVQTLLSDIYSFKSADIYYISNFLDNVNNSRTLIQGEEKQIGKEIIKELNIQKSLKKNILENSNSYTVNLLPYLQNGINDKKLKEQNKENLLIESFFSDYEYENENQIELEFDNDKNEEKDKIILEDENDYENQMELEFDNDKNEEKDKSFSDEEKYHSYWYSIRATQKHFSKCKIRKSLKKVKKRFTEKSNFEKNENFQTWKKSEIIRSKKLKEKRKKYLLKIKERTLMIKKKIFSKNEKIKSKFGRIIKKNKFLEGFALL
jgi:transposase-like protein